MDLRVECVCMHLLRSHAGRHTETPGACDQCACKQFSHRITAEQAQRVQDFAATVAHEEARPCTCTHTRKAHTVERGDQSWTGACGGYSRHCDGDEISRCQCAYYVPADLQRLVESIEMRECRDQIIEARKRFGLPTWML